MKLIVGVLPSRSGSDNAPIVYLEGGPGAHALDTLQFQFTEIWDPLLDDFDLIFFDQRGTGFSEPSLRCPELTRVTRDAEDDPSLAPAQLQALGDEALGACASGFRNRGIDTAQYNTVNNARDADAIREALGYDEWNLLGISYGTRLALDMMRQFPETIRSAVIDSVYPPQVDATKEQSQTFLDSFELVSAACDAEPACAAEGNLSERLIAAAADLEAQPREVEVVNFLTGATDTVQANGDAVVGLVAGGLYSPFAFTDWPELLTDLESGGGPGRSRSTCRWIEPTKHSSPPGCSTRSNATRRSPSPIPTRSTQHHQRIPLASTTKRSVMATPSLPVLLWAVSPPIRCRPNRSRATCQPWCLRASSIPSPHRRGVRWLLRRFPILSTCCCPANPTACRLATVATRSFRSFWPIQVGLLIPHAPAMAGNLPSKVRVKRRSSSRRYWPSSVLDKHRSFNRPAGQPKLWVASSILDGATQYSTSPRCCSSRVRRWLGDPSRA